jgi:hypothetical protein
MNPMPELERVFPLSGGSPERMPLRAPCLSSGVAHLPRMVMANRAVLRAWAARRAAWAAGPALAHTLRSAGGRLTCTD